MSAPVELYIIHLTGARAGGVDTIQVGEEPAILGRAADSAVRFHAEHDIEVSKRHAELGRREGRFVLRDLSSRNGTYVNGRLVSDVFLRQGDVVRLGADGPQIKVDLSGREVASVLRTLRRRRWRVVWVPLVLLIGVGLGFGAIYVAREWDRRRSTIEDTRLGLDEEIDALLAVLDGGDAGDFAAVAARYDRLVELEGEAAAIADPGQRARDAGAMERRVDDVLRAFGEPTYRVPRSFREAVRSRVGTWLGTTELGEIFCASEASMPALRSVLSRYAFPDVVAFLPWVLSGGRAEAEEDGRVGLWAIGEAEGLDLGLVEPGGEDRRTDALASTEAIAAQLQRDLEALSTSSVLLATTARDDQVAATVAQLREDDAWTRNRRTVRFLWLSGLLDGAAREQIPQLVAAAVIGRSPDQYGLGAEACGWQPRLGPALDAPPD